jgi:holo-[acyl-carrier protein] synthase
MKIKCGTDIIEIDRIKESIESLGEKFLRKVFTENEIKYCESKKAQKYQHYAARFAAKEAVFKAISESLTNKFLLGWCDYEILNDETGKPNVKIRGINIENIENIDLSISHCKKYAVATAIAIYK